MNWLKVVVLLATCGWAAGLNVLILVSIVGKSHLDFASTLLDVLVSRGHNVDFALLRMNDVVVGNGSSKASRVFEVNFPEPGYWRSQMQHLKGFFDSSWQGYVPNWTAVSFRICRLAVEEGRFFEFAAQGNYDVAITSDYDFCGTTILRRTGIPAVATFIATPIFPIQYTSAGLPSPASIYSETMRDHDGSLLGRIEHLYRAATYLYSERPEHIQMMNDLTRKHFGADFPDAGLISSQVDVVFVNSNEVIEEPRPISHKIKYIGGIQVRRPKPLPQEIDRQLNASAPNVLFSFGTQVPTKLIPLEIRRNFVRAFKMMPHLNFLWKYDTMDDDVDLFANTTNIHRMPWLPQSDLLRDPRVVAFISHMGQNSYIESAAAGRPVLAVPLVVDQFHNAKNAAAKGMALVLNKHELSAENIVASLQRLLEDPTYTQNARRIAKMLAEKPEKAEETFVAWLEFAAKNPRLHEMLNLPGNNWSPFWYYCGDVILLFLFVFAAVSYFSYKFALLAIRFWPNRISIRLASKSSKSD